MAVNVDSAMTLARQMRRCEVCGKFFDVPLLRSDSRGVPMVRISGPWVCSRVHETGEARQLEWSLLGNVFAKGLRR